MSSNKLCEKFSSVVPLFLMQIWSYVIVCLFRHCSVSVRLNKFCAVSDLRMRNSRAQLQTGTPRIHCLWVCVLLYQRVHLKAGARKWVNAHSFLVTPYHVCLQYRQRLCFVKVETDALSEIAECYNILPLRNCRSALLT